MITNTRIIKH